MNYYLLITLDIHQDKFQRKFEQGFCHYRQQKIESVGQEVLSVRTKTGITEPAISRIRKKFPMKLYTIELEEFEPDEFTEEDHKEVIERLTRYYPKIGRRIYITPNKTMKEVYEEMLQIIEKEKWTPRKPKR